jgi:hypothetical protein
MMLAPNVLPLLSLISFALASYTCDSSTGFTPEQLVATSDPPPDSGSGSGSGSSAGFCLYPSCPLCGQDPTGLLCDNWHKSQLQGGFDQAISGSTSLFGTFAKRSLQSRATTLECTDDEVCLILPSLFLCVDPTSLNFEDSNGGSGNLDSDIYTMSNGDVTSVASTATAVPTPTGSGSKATTTPTGTQVTAAAAGTKTTSTGGVKTGQSDASAAEIINMNNLLRVTLAVVGAAGVLL